MNWLRILIKNVIATISTLFILVALPAHAHKLNVFSWTGDNQVYGEAFFSGGRKAKNIPVHIQNAESLSSLLTTRTDEEGKFQFALPQQAVQQKTDLLITVDTGDGHRGEWLLTTDEYLPAAADSPRAAQQSPEEKSAAESMTPETLRAIVRQELARELAPVKRSLAEGREKKITLRDILGGIGCIIGLAGILAWFQAKKKNSTAG